MTINRDEIRAKAKDLFGNTDESNSELNTVRNYAQRLENENKELRALLAEAQGRPKRHTPNGPRVYTRSTPPPADVTLLRDESRVFPFLRRVGDLWAWSQYESQVLADTEHCRATPWADAAACARGALTEVR
jgi:hypothetical protein